MNNSHPTKLDPAQRAAVESTAATIVCVAGPGAGKSTTLCARIAHLLDNGLTPSRIVALTFTNAAAAELRRRLNGAPLGYCGTLHGFMLRLLQRFGQAVGYAGAITVLDEEQAQAFLERTMAEHRYRGAKCVLEEALKAGPFAVAGGHLTPAELVAFSYYDQMRQGGMICYDAILHFGYKLLRAPEVHSQLESELTHLFVDETQDSSALDWEIYDALPCTHKFWVADADQSLYAFRGAMPEQLVSRVAALRASSGGEVHILDTNYRSGYLICAAATRLIGHNRQRVPKAVLPCKGAKPGTILLNPWNPATPTQEMAMLAAHLKADPNPRECAVLLRTNFLVKQYGDFLKEYGVPVAMEQRPQRPADWRLARATVSLLCAPDNDHAAHYLLTQLEGAAAADAARMTALANFTSINQTLWGIPCEVTLDNLPPGLIHRLSFESRSLILEEWTQLPAGATVGELAVRLTELDAEQEVAGEGVTVCTFHKAKGLEWDSVFLPAFEQGVVTKGKSETMEEDRRAAFVAVTRARHSLVVSWCASRQSQWQKTPQPATPSQFVGEMMGT